MNKRVLVTGGSGFIGYALIKELKSLNYDVTVLDRNEQPQNFFELKFLPRSASSPSLCSNLGLKSQTP